MGLIFPIASKAVGTYTMFYIFGGLVFLGLPYLFGNVKETKGV